MSACHGAVGWGGLECNPGRLQTEAVKESMQKYFNVNKVIFMLTPVEVHLYIACSKYKIPQSILHQLVSLLSQDVQLPEQAV